ncbi:MAG: DUF3037 domain-containing protein [Caldilineaceae bacterium]
MAAAIDGRGRLRALAPDLDIELVREQLELIPRLCAGEGPVGSLGRAEAFHWITAPHSTIIQASPVHGSLRRPSVRWRTAGPPRAAPVYAGDGVRTSHR